MQHMHGQYCTEKRRTGRRGTLADLPPSLSLFGVGARYRLAINCTQLEQVTLRVCIESLSRLAAGAAGRGILAWASFCSFPPRKSCSVLLQTFSVCRQSGCALAEQTEQNCSVQLSTFSKSTLPKISLEAQCQELASRRRGNPRRSTARIKNNTESPRERERERAKLGQCPKRIRTLRSLATYTSTLHSCCYTRYGSCSTNAVH